MENPVITGSSYAGEVLQQLLVNATTGNEIVERGLIKVQPNISMSFTLPRLRASNMLQKRKESPKTGDSKGKFSLTEKKLTPQDVMAYVEFNPRILESFWRPWQPTGNLVFTTLPPEAQNAFLAELAKVVTLELGDHFINGEKGTEEGKYFDGVLTRIKADSEVLRVTNPTAITAENIFDVLKRVRAMIPGTIKKNPNLRIMMSTDDYEKYDAASTALVNKGVDSTKLIEPTYKGVKIEALAAWPENCIVAVVASDGLDSNIWAGVSLVNDAEVVQIDKTAAASELYFFKMLMKADTNIVFGEEIVLYDATGAVVTAASEPLGIEEIDSEA